VVFVIEGKGGRRLRRAEADVVVHVVIMVIVVGRGRGECHGGHHGQRRTWRHCGRRLYKWLDYRRDEREEVRERRR
jgi:hypothetical protein